MRMRLDQERPRSCRGAQMTAVGVGEPVNVDGGHDGHDHHNHHCHHDEDDTAADADADAADADATQTSLGQRQGDSVALS